jgi:hypothetical protein
MATLDEWGEPSYFAFVDHSPIHTKFYEGLPQNEFGGTIFLLEFAEGDLNTPVKEPIGVYHYAGIRRYLWRENYWNEYNIDTRYFMDRTKELLQNETDPTKALEYRKLLGMLQSYASAAVIYPQRLGSLLWKPKKRKARHYWRVVYKISQRQG